MKKQYKLHRWLAVGIGLFLVIQVVSGAVWMLPWPGPVKLREAQSALQWSPGLISFEEAARRVEQPTEVRLQMLDGAPVYTVFGARTVVVDAQRGGTIEIDEALARRVAQRATGAKAARVQKVQRHSIGYRSGALPAFKVYFEDARKTMVAVDARTGALIKATSRAARFQNLFESLHDWSVVSMYTPVRRGIWSVVVLLSAVSLVAILSGYWLAWLRWKRRLERAGQRAEQ